MSRSGGGFGGGFLVQAVVVSVPRPAAPAPQAPAAPARRAPQVLPPPVRIHPVVERVYLRAEALALIHSGVGVLEITPEEQYALDTELAPAAALHRRTLGEPVVSLYTRYGLVSLRVRRAA